MALDGIAGSLSVLGEQPIPDLMNDPQYATNTGNNEDGTGDADTCRICRGEATDQEPLFYPCKCSGSIKFVHQDCLMEWLSHSQKKHCELCKTPFRFTKLYAPNMPQSLPTHVFIRHLVIHTIKNLAIWLRFFLVVFVWLGCLPWAMRHVWGLLFWFGDGGWSSKMPGLNPFSNDTAKAALDFQRAREHLNTLVSNGTSPASPLLMRPTTSAVVGTFLDNITGLLEPMARILNLSNTELFAMSFFKDIYSGLSLSSETLNSTFTTQAPRDYGSDISGHESLLSEVRFLKGLTKNLGLNRIIITALEGQIITIVVVVCFVLVFLIREWVVQQQPGINMGAGFNAEFAGGERAARNRNILPENAPDAEGLPVNGARNIEELQDMVQRPPADVAARPIARPRRRMVRFEDGQGHDPRPADRHRDALTVQQASVRDGERENAGEGPVDIKSHQRPGTLARDALSPAAEVQRQLTEDSSKQQDQFNASEFVSVWRRAGGSPEEVLRIIEAEGLGEKLRYWKNAKGLQGGSTHASSSNEPKRTNGLISSIGGANEINAQCSDESTSTKESWLEVPTELGISKDHNHFPPSQENQNGDFLSSSDKGKQKMVDHLFEPLLEASNGRTSDSITMIPHPSGTDEEPSLSSVTSPPSRISFQSSPGRPRANLDWPQPRETIPPMTEKHWSFSSLPELSPNTSAPGSTFSISEEFWKGLKAPSSEENGPAEGRGELVSASGQDSLTSIPTCDKLSDRSHEELERIEIYSPESGTSRIAQSWEEEFTNNPISDSEDESHNDAIGASAIETTPFPADGVLQEDVPLLQDRDQHPVQREQPRGLWGRIANFLWGDINVAQEVRAGDDEHIVQDIAAEAPFVPVVHHHGRGIFDNDDTDDEGEVNQDREVLAAALAAGIDPNDPDGLDDVEDFDGIMELVGMRGPFTALLQNGIFSAVLISLTVACGVWLPYNIGRLVVLLIANPVTTVKLPLRFLFSFAAVLQDLALVALGTLSYLLIQLFSLPSHLYFYSTSSLAPLVMIDQSAPALESMRFAKTAADRIISSLIIAVMQIPDSEVPAFSAVSHEALLQIKDLITKTLEYVGALASSIFASSTGRSNLINISMDFGAVWTTISDFGNTTVDGLQRMPDFLTAADSWVISLEIPSRAVPVDPSLSYWSGTDRFWAILVGYFALSLLGAAYLRKGSPFSTSQVGREWEATIIDILNQAGGVMKVILIISIEMLVFPLYCGLLLDLALLPLFENATILSRILFTIDSPLTSVFVHWFVGTCYMFHFALFVSMCRKIMRNGVLYFIRDPDDPTFHPVRDVLERNVATQLRKITFSAMVYGALVVICLGGVVWGLSFAFPGVLPIHWSSNEPVLEFPIDLLFYNFFMPLAVKFFKPSDGLHAMYAWWFRKCARMLRLTWFLFDERRLDEEGHHIRKSWSDYLRGTKGDVTNPVKSSHSHDLFQTDPTLRAYFLQDGMFVRAPASDQVRIPKGVKVFLGVDETNMRVDGRQDVEEGLHGRNSELFKMVYIPPHFRSRIFLFILFIWIFAAVTGVSITIVPLVFGRQIFAKVIPAHVRKNDVYAFSIGIYILGSALYSIMHIRQGMEYLRNSFAINAETPAKIIHKISNVGLLVARIIYAYTAFIIVLPSLFAFAIEFYFIVPLHTYFAVSEPHVIHFVQSWTLGLLYVKLTTRLILWHNDSRPAEALRAVTRNGYLDPDVKIATRAFIIPATTILLTALIFPFFLALLANHFAILGPGEEQRILAFRYAYPFCLSMIINATGAWLLFGVMKGWRMKIRDEVYLIGERLHNFGDRNKSGTAALIPTGTRLET